MGAFWGPRAYFGECSALFDVYIYVGGTNRVYVAFWAFLCIKNYDFEILLLYVLCTCCQIMQLGWGRAQDEADIAVETQGLGR